MQPTCSSSCSCRPAYTRPQTAVIGGRIYDQPCDVGVNAGSPAYRPGGRSDLKLSNSSVWTNRVAGRMLFGM